MKKMFVLILLLASATALGQARRKFYVTGYAAGGDCGHPAIVVYGKDRLDALHKAGISLLRSGVTVWTTAEYARMRKEIGKRFDEFCGKAKAALVVPSPITVHPPIDVPPATEEYGNPGYEVCDMGNCAWVDEQEDHTVTGHDYAVPVYKRRTRPTCADKTRFLMTSEDGKKHCIKLGEDAQ